jgi:hypothetical protein
MDQETYPFPRCNLFVRPDTGGVEIGSRGFVRYKGSLPDDQCARYTRTRGIVLDGEIRVSMFVVSPKAGYWRHDHSVLEGDFAELQRLKEFRSAHWKSRGL